VSLKQDVDGLLAFPPPVPPGVAPAAEGAACRESASATEAAIDRVEHSLDDLVARCYASGKPQAVVDIVNTAVAGARDRLKRLMLAPECAGANSPGNCSDPAQKSQASCVLACELCAGANDVARYNQLKGELDTATQKLNQERKEPADQQDNTVIDEAEATLERVLNEFNQCATCASLPRNADACLNKPKPDVKRMIRDIQNRRERFCATGSSVFWSGGKAGAEAAQAWARSHGGQTLEQTPGGAALEQRDLFSRNSCSGFTRKEAAAVWNAASIAFAECATGPVLKFQDCTIVRSPDSLGTWERLEKPILQSQGLAIIGYDFRGKEEPLCD
jgi:hypothetical protein